ncbi:MAG: hypothetical protein F6K19_31590 [Cyanothece sp. SIO1E1]|nr:hypothetical protein [Cyanothece sp. SIO1E1]
MISILTTVSVAGTVGIESIVGTDSTVGTASVAGVTIHSLAHSQLVEPLGVDLVQPGEVDLIAGVEDSTPLAEDSTLGEVDLAAVSLALDSEVVTTVLLLGVITSLTTLLM